MYEVLPGVLEQSRSLRCKYYTVKFAYEITPIKQSPVLKGFCVCTFSFGHCVICSSSIYDF